MSKDKTAIEKIEWLQGERSIGRFRVGKLENDDLSTLLNQIITAIKKEKKQICKEQREGIAQKIEDTYNLDPIPYKGVNEMVKNDILTYTPSPIQP